jgi:L-lactate dehydrogenase (cytochrome)
MTTRRLPRVAELAELLRPAPFELSATERALRRAASISDLRALARRRAPEAVFDYTDGGSGVGELALRRARSVFARLEFRPSVLTDVSKVNTETSILGKPSALPFALSPTGYTRMMHTQGERAVVRAAARAGIPYSLSTMGTCTIEQVAEAAPDARTWFQLYVWRDRGLVTDLVTRAGAAGYDTLLLTVDTPVGGMRLRDHRNGLTIPPQLRLRTFVDGAMHPRWWFDLLTTEPLRFASLGSTNGRPGTLADRLFDPGLNMTDLAWLRSQWPGKLLVKGVQSVADAVRCVDAGADGVVISSHGGRQLDRAPVPLELVPDVREALDGRAEVLMDTGITTGADIVAALALGAHAAMVGRAYLYGLMAAGERGVDKAIGLLSDELTRTMALLGVTSVDQLSPSHVRIRPVR